MSVKSRKILMTADMTSVNRSCHSGNRLVGQLYHFVVNIANTEAGINKKANESISMKLSVNYL